MPAATVAVVAEGDAVYLETDLPAEFDRARLGPVAGRDLERVRFADADFEEPDGTPAVMDLDLTGEQKLPGRRSAAGPVAELTSGHSRTQVWASRRRSAQHVDLRQSSAATHRPSSPE